MKKMLLLAATVLGCAFAEASEPEKIEALSAKVIMQNSNGYFAFSDGSCWKAIGFAKRWRTLSEWWNNVQLVPAEYECLPNDWFVGTQIQVYQKYGNLTVSESDASNQDALKQCTHLLVNARTGQVLFAIALHPADCLVQLSNEAREDGYNEGFSKGRLKSYQNATEVYNDGYQAGYTAGFKDGVRAEQQPGS